MISHTEAQELHRLIGGAVETGIPLSLENLERALELAALIVADTEPSPVSYAPCIQGTIEIGGRKSEFMIPLDRDDVGFSQWGTDNTVLWERVDLLDTISKAAKEWAYDNRPDNDEEIGNPTPDDDEEDNDD